VLAYAQPSIYETEPNDKPAEANPISSPVNIIGSMAGDDQDAFLWTVSDVDAQKRWTFELKGIPGRLTIVDVLRVVYADNGVDVTSLQRLFKMGTRDGSLPSIHEDLLFEPGEYILGVAYAGGGAGYRPPVDRASFGDLDPDSIETTAETGGYRLVIREGSRLPLETRPKDRASIESAVRLRPGYETAAFLATPDTWYRFDVGDKDSEQRWDIYGQVPVGRKVTATFRGDDGTRLATTSANDKGKLIFRDLVLDQGSYTIEVKSRDAGYIRALGTIAVGERIEGAEAEPNNQFKQANRVSRLPVAWAGRATTTSSSSHLMKRRSTRCLFFDWRPMPSSSSSFACSITRVKEFSAEQTRDLLSYPISFCMPVIGGWSWAGGPRRPNTALA